MYPSTDTETGVIASISSFDIPADIDNYYWLSPSQFTGNKLTAYGSSLHFSISWVIMRGDSSGQPLHDPDVVIIVSPANLSDYSPLQQLLFTQSCNVNN